MTEPKLFTIVEKVQPLWGPTQLFFQTNMKLSYTNPLNGKTATIRKGTTYRLTLYNTYTEMGHKKRGYQLGNIQRFKGKTSLLCPDYECLQYVKKNEKGQIVHRENVVVVGYELAMSTAVSILLMQATNGDNYEGSLFKSPSAASLFYKSIGVTITECVAKEKVHAVEK